MGSHSVGGQGRGGVRKAAGMDAQPLRFGREKTQGNTDMLHCDISTFGFQNTNGRQNCLGKTAVQLIEWL